MLKRLQKQTPLAVMAALALGLVLAGLAAPLAAQTSNPAPPELETAARQIAAARLGVPESEITTIGSATVPLTELGTVVYDFKLAHEPTDSYLQVTVDDAGVEQDLETLFTQEQDQHYAKYGALSPEFHQTLIDAPPGTSFEALIYVRMPFVEPAIQRPDPDTDPTEADVEAAATANDTDRQQAVAAAVQPVVDQLTGMGFLAEVDDLAPVVHTVVPSDILLNDIAWWGEVLQIESGEELAEPMLEIQLPACQTNVVHNQGITGAGTRLAAIEVGGQMNASNPFFSCLTQNTLFSCQSSHSAAVSGIIASNNTARLGHAYNTCLYLGGSCGGWPWQLRYATNWAAWQNARAFNLSFGAYRNGYVGGLDRYYDGLVQSGWRTVVPAAGNSGSGGYVASPGTAYNVVTVGSDDDRNTTYWPDDVMSSFSSTLNPRSWIGDRIKPEVTAPGTNINSTTNSSPWTGAVGSGTSFAAPAVTGISGLLMQRSPGLRVWPEAVKAILMASAEHNIEGAARLSNRDGAGAVVADRADRVARKVSGVGNWGGRYYNCSSPWLQSLTTVNLTAGQRIRFDMTWDASPNAWGYWWRPGADLDLWVSGPTSWLVAGSFSWDNTYEIVDFTAPATGSYNFQVRKYRCTANPYWLGWAWHIVP